MDMDSRWNPEEQDSNYLKSLENLEISKQDEQVIQY